jgi:hypothetical protein
MKSNAPHSHPHNRFRHLKKAWLCLFTVFVLFLLTCWGILRVYGLPENMEKWIIDELNKKDIVVSVDKIYINGKGRFAANNVRVTSIFKYPVELAVENISLGLNLFSWMQGKPLIDRLLVKASNVSYKIDETTSAKIDSVSTDIQWDVNRIEVNHIDLQVLQYNIHLQGRLAQDEPEAEQKKFNPEDIAKVWEKVELVSKHVKSKNPIEIRATFDTPLHHPLKGKATLQVIGTQVTAYGILIPEVFLGAELDQDQVTITPSRIGFVRGQIVPEGKLNLIEKKGFVFLNANVDPSGLYKLLPPKSHTTANLVRYLDTLGIYAEASLDWNEKFTYFAKFDTDCDEFLIDKNLFRDFALSGSFDGQQFYISNVTLKDSIGQINLSMLLQKDKSLKGRLKSSVNPKSFMALFGEGGKPFWNSIAFNRGLLIDAEIESPSLKLDDIKVVNGNVWVEDAAYKKVNIRKAMAKFTYAKGEFHFKNGYLEDKKAGYLIGDEVYYRPKLKWVNVIKAESTMVVPEMSRIFSSKLEEYVTPYVFSVPPTLKVSGILDLEEHKETNFKIHIQTPNNVSVPLFQKQFVFSNIDLDLNLFKNDMTIKTRKPATLFKGKSNVDLKMTLLEPTPYQTKFDAEGIDFQEMMTNLFNKKDVSGKFSTYMEISGNLADMKAMKGYGEAYIEDGELYNVPFLIGLKEILDVIIPGGFSKLSKAESKFRIENGKMLLDKMNMYSTALAMIGGGQYDFVENKVDMSMRVNFRGPLGLATFAISKLLEYKGSGTLQNTKWE